MTSDPVISRPLPNLREWLEAQGVATPTGDGYGKFSALAEWSLKLLDQKSDVENEKVLIAFLQALSIAAVETSNLLVEQGCDTLTVVLMMNRAMGIVSMSAVASTLVEDAPFRDVASTLIDEFRFAMKQTADSMAEDREAE